MTAEGVFKQPSPELSKEEKHEIIKAQLEALRQASAVVRAYEAIRGKKMPFDRTFRDSSGVYQHNPILTHPDVLFFEQFENILNTLK